jgi:hypothetical protein
MPEVVLEPVNFPGRGRRDKINWDAVSDGKVYKLIPGKDFATHVDFQTVQSSAHQAAKRRNKLCRTVTDGDCVMVQFYSEAASKPSKKSKKQ